MRITAKQAGPLAIAGLIALLSPVAMSQNPAQGNAESIRVPDRSQKALFEGKQ
jgi:hypothetical protein